MKTILFALALACAIPSVESSFATTLTYSPQHFETTTFKVYGNCTMCKKTIETAVKKNPNVQSADWNVDTKMITVVYNPHSVSLDEIHQLIAHSGYDTDKVKAPDAAYKKLPGCCQYERVK